MQPALLVRLEQQEQLVQAPRAPPEPPAQMESREPQGLPGLLAPLALRVQLALALRAPQVLRVPVLPAQLEPQVLAPLGLQELAQQVLRAPVALKERRVQVLTALAEPLGQPAPQVLQGLVLLAQLAPLAQEYLARQERRGLAQAAQQEPRDHKDFLLASLTTKQKQRQQVVTQATDLFFGIMPRKLMQQNC